jgi:hypothetical protein
MVRMQRLGRQRGASATLMVVVGLASVIVTAQQSLAGQPVRLSRAATTTIKTQYKQVAPVDRAGGLAHGYRITQTLTGGTCNRSVVGAVAYRCVSPNASPGHPHGGSGDPCWTTTADPTGRTVLCLAHPWSTDVVRIRGLSSLPPSLAGDKATRTPWGLTLDNGLRCDAIRGTRSELHGRYANWGCNNNVSVLQPLHTRISPWRADTVFVADDGSLRRGPTRAILTAWYPIPSASARPR